jgi:hypothetical protein
MVVRADWKRKTDAERKAHFREKVGAGGDRVGICVHPAKGTPDIPRFLFLALDTSTLMPVVTAIKQQLVQDPKAGFSKESALWLFVDKKNLVPLSETVSSLVAQFPSDDGFLHVTYAVENVFGNV